MSANSVSICRAWGTISSSRRRRDRRSSSASCMAPVTPSRPVKSDFMVSASAVSCYAINPQVQIVENSGQAQGVRETHLAEEEIIV